MYLSDNETTQWQFPDGTEIGVNAYFIVWCEEDHDGEEVPEGWHSNLKLSKRGETVLLVDTDATGNKALDTVTFEEQETDVAIGQIPNGIGDFQVVIATLRVNRTE